MDKMAVNDLLQSTLDLLGIDRTGVHDPIQATREARLHAPELSRLLKELLVEMIGMEVDTP